jgi:hypothetical protein
MFCKVLRLYTMSGTGKSAALTFSEDIVLADANSGWPSDDHGIATDGTYLYQISFINGYKVWALASHAPSYVVFDGAGSGACGASNGISPSQCPTNSPITGSDNSLANGTFLGRNHVSGAYLMGDYSGNRFYRSTSATPPPGPGNLPPTYTSITPDSRFATGGETLTITGTNLLTTSNITIGGLLASIVNRSPT